MPTYDYQCRSCGSVTEVIHSMLEEGPSVCERCGGQLRRVLFPAGIIFKGSGFYRTDSRSSGKESGSSGPSKGSESSSGSSSDSGSSESSGGGESKPSTSAAGEAPKAADSSSA